MLTNHIALAETSPIEDLTDWTERREALRIRPLIECPRLRATLGNAAFPTQAAAAATGASTSKKWNKRMPSMASAPAINARTKHGSRPKVAAR